MSDRRFIKPAPGLSVHDPETGRPLVPQGRGVAWNSWWQRRWNDRDVIATTEAEIAAAEKAAEKAAAKAATKPAEGSTEQ
ncbi:DUF2635 domain-containing protein [Sphingomonas hengshuiensis]|uniref:DUF2635 domain-containing protein n=1 Tax=Sphingomonas hengshuiensis TaxID=1609977 RepID=A0A7U4JAB9_9SPHN|nr:DUF2635 domain-containing protein [Sphingomonas hengshuiensis]AJP73166.1 hypothetical protein TS85_17275 [Sphingomonas hengshuiensis]